MTEKLYSQKGNEIKHNLGQRSSRLAGFTFLELVFAILILSILSYHGVYYAKPFYVEQSRNTHLTTLRDTFGHIRILSLISDKTIHLDFDLTKNQISIRKGSKILLNLNKPNLSPINFRYVAFGNLSESPKTLSFYPSGTLTPGSLLLEEGNKACSFTFTLRGFFYDDC